MTEVASISYRAYLRKCGVSYILAGKAELDCEMAMGKLHRLFHIERLLICGGGAVDWTFLQADMVDELSLVLSPGDKLSGKKRRDKNGICNLIKRRKNADSGIRSLSDNKVWVEHYGYEETKKSVEESLCKLQTDYLDLMLLHQPFNDYYGAYRALVDLASFTRIPPMVNQIETHVLNQCTEDHEWMNKYHVAHEAWVPFGEGRGGLFDNAVLKQIGEKYGKTAAQVMLRWNIQRGVIVLPKSTHKERMIQNLEVFDFALTDEDMSAIAGLDTKTSAFFSHYDPNMVEWFVRMVEERKQQHDSSKEKKN